MVTLEQLCFEDTTLPLKSSGHRPYLQLVFEQGQNEGHMKNPPEN